MENEKRGFALTVVLVLVAAIVAGNFAIKPARTASPITPTGYYTLGQGCSWQETSFYGFGRAMCPASRPNVVAGGCNTAYRTAITESFPLINATFNPQGWECATSGTSGIAYANCCK